LPFEELIVIGVDDDILERLPLGMPDNDA